MKQRKEGIHHKIHSHFKDRYKEPQPTVQEFIFLNTHTFIFLIFYTLIDMVIHDGYVRPIIAECYESNKSALCEQLRFELLSDASPIVQFFRENILSAQDLQLQLGSQYWMMLSLIVIFISVLFGVNRIFSGYMAGAKINPMLFINGGLWSFSLLSFYYFGWLDYFYFILRGLPIPETLNWLDGVGLFQYVQGFGATSSVDSSDLYGLMSVGTIIYVSIWAFMIHHHKKGLWKRLKLI